MKPLPPKRIIFLQPTIPSYRLGFFNRLAKIYGSQLMVYASHINMGAISARQDGEIWEHRVGSITAISPGLFWQRGVLAIRVTKGDVVVISGNVRGLSNLVLLFKSRFANATTVWWGHYRSSTTVKWRLKLRMLLMRMSHVSLFYTDREITECLRSGVIDSSRPVFALNNGIDVSPIQRVRKKYNASTRRRSVLFIGRLTEKAELGLLLQAMAINRNASFQLNVVGDGEEMSELKALAAELGLKDRVIWHGGLVDEKRIADVANTCRLFVYPGSVGLSLIHAFAYGLPAVMHDDRNLHMPEHAAFENDENGCSFEKDNARSLATAIVGLIDDNVRLEKYSQSALEKADNEFNVDVMSLRFNKMINTIAPNFHSFGL
jgi:glycosyltransferase involved in cell wall biosynthesis